MSELLFLQNVGINELPDFTSKTIMTNEEGVIQPKSVRKDASKISDLKKQSLFPPNFSLGDNYIENARNGGRYICYEGNNTNYWLKIRGVDNITNNVTNLRIVSGPCLFSSSTAQAEISTNVYQSLTDPSEIITSEIKSINTQKEITIYEAEAIERLARTIGEFVGNSDLPTSVVMNVPRTEYYLYILDAIQQGRIAVDLAEEWFNTVNERSDRIKRLFTRRIQQYSNKDITINYGNILDQVGEYIRSCVVEGYTPSIDELLQLITNENPVAMKIVQEIQPQDYQALNYVGYVYEEIVNGLNGNTAIAIENPTEERIYAQAEAISKKLGLNMQTFAVYPFPKVINLEAPQGNLYFYKEKATISSVKKVLRQYR